jgi:hypothetical protein
MLGLEWPHYALRFLNSQILLFRRVVEEAEESKLWAAIFEPAMKAAI